MKYVHPLVARYQLLMIYDGAQSSKFLFELPYDLMAIGK